tara:strand:+ start:12764 stop:14218 length:1455 start_codon:yes stop_codon:yes gene_type:complete
MSIPQSIDYTSILPMAVESRARRRGFVPSNGASFVSNQNNIIEIPVSASAFLDTKHSFLRMNFLNTTGQSFGVDYGGGHGLISRLRILQAGTVLSDCREYGRLMSSIILPCAANQTNLATRSIKEGQRFGNSSVVAAVPPAAARTPLDPAEGANEVTGATVNTPTNANDSTCLAAAGSNYVFSIPLMNGLLGTTQDKLIPLFLLNNAPVVIEITLAPSLDIGVFGGGPGAYTIDNVRYMAALVETGPEVEDQIRMVQAGSGGRLVLNGVDYTHHPGIIPANVFGRVMLDIPVRKKSIKSVLFVGAASNYAGGAAAQDNRFNLSYGGTMSMSEYQLSVGSRRIPEVPIGFQAIGTGSADFKAQYFSELAKCFGETGSAHGLGVQSRINNSNQTGSAANMAVPSAGNAALVSHVFCPYGIDCEAFQPDGKGGGALESGVDTATTSQPFALNLDIGSPLGSPITVDMYVVHDSLYFIDTVGNLRVAL